MADYKIGMGKRIRELRRRIGMMQEELSEQFGVSVKHMSEAERGISGLSVENLVKLCDIFGVTLDYLIRGEESDDLSDAIVLPLKDVRPDKTEDLYRLIKAGIDLAR